MPLDDVYFAPVSWADRVQRWLRRERGDGGNDPFLEGNLRVIRQVLHDPETGLRMVINISADALMRFLEDGEYRNLYQHPVIGGKRRKPSPERRTVDQLLGFGGKAANIYFGAVALGGTGIRFYGEYCLALRPDALQQDTPLFDRDSYDVLMPPLSEEKDLPDLVERLKGSWGADLVDMLTLKLLPELRGAQRLVTTGTVSEMTLHDQEYVEVHREGTITPAELEEVRQSPDEVAMEARILARMQAGFPPTAVEMRWRAQRDRVVQALESRGIRYRIVTLHGRGYQWR